MEQPEGIYVQGLEHLIIHLKRAIYGLKQAGLFIYREVKASSSLSYMLMVPCSAD